MTQQTIRQRLDDHWENIIDIIPDANYDFVLSLAETIAQFENILATAPKDFRALLGKVSSDVNKLLDSARELDRRFPDFRTIVDITELIDLLARFPAIELPRAGEPEARLNRSRKILTANRAFLYMLQFTYPLQKVDLIPPLTGNRDGVYVRFSNILFEVATGQSEPDLYRECCEVINTWRQLPWNRRQD
jgi:hypothetical protein